MLLTALVYLADVLVREKTWSWWEVAAVRVILTDECRVQIHKRDYIPEGTHQRERLPKILEGEMRKLQGKA